MNKPPSRLRRDAADTGPALMPASSSNSPPTPHGAPHTPPAHESPVRQRPADLLLHWVLLWIASGVLAASLLLRVGGGDKVLLPVIDAPLPGVCTYKRWVGTECPGCGLTRCFISLAHGDVTAAWHFNPAGLLFFVIVAGQIPYRAWQIWRIRRGRRELVLHWCSALLVGLLVTALFAQWVWRTWFT